MTVPPTNNEASLGISSSTGLPKSTPPANALKTGAVARALHLGETHPISALKGTMAEHHISSPLGGGDSYARICRQTERLTAEQQRAIREQSEVCLNEACDTLSSPHERLALRCLCQAGPSLLAKAEMEHEFFHFDQPSNNILWHTQKEITPEGFLTAFKLAQPHIPKTQYDHFLSQLNDPGFASQMVPQRLAPSPSQPRLMMFSFPKAGQAPVPAAIIPQTRVKTLVALAHSTRNAMANAMVNTAQTLGISLDVEEKKAEQQERTVQSQAPATEPTLAAILSHPQGTSRTLEELASENKPTGPSQGKIAGKLAEEAKKEQEARIKRDDEFQKELKDTQQTFDRIQREESKREEGLKPFKKPMGR